MTVAISGFGTTIAREFCARVPSSEQIVTASIDALPLDADRYLICTGYLAGRALGEIAAQDAGTTWLVNFQKIARQCDEILAHNERARICIIGSESGYAGSYDMTYAGAKAAIHLYIETKRLTAPGQQIVGIAPTVIADSGMTQRRRDRADCIKRADQRRRGEWISASDVGALAHFLLYVDRGNICNTIVRMTGGL